jgi:nitrogen-specific signal transduction histidine kinase/CheY-like chemotaxis protein
MVFEGRQAALVVAQDVTERKRLQQQFYQAQKMEAIGQLAGGVAHDFNNLLTGILGYCDLLLGNWPAGHEGRDDLVEIQKAGVNAAGLTRQLLAFSRKQILERRVADLNDVVADAAKMLHRLVREDIEMEVRQAPDLWRVHADVGQLNQVLVNLVVNARDAMPNGGRLTIETANATLDASYSTTRLSVTPGPYVMLAVTDEGEGMTPELQRRLFEPFFTTKGPGAGTGLGLATILGIVQQHEGGIQVYSEPGRGTTFKIYLPATEASADVVAETRAVLPMNGTETILVVEDQPSLVRLTTRILRARGYTVLGASSADEAMRVAESHQGAIDLLVTDVVMPGESGPALAERLAQRRPAMRVLCMSGYAPEAIVRHGLVRDGIAFIPKPFTPDGLAKKVREVLSAAPPRARNA